MQRECELARTALLTGLLAVVGAARAGQEQLNQQAPPDSAQESQTPLERGFEQPPVIRQLNRITDALKQKFQHLPPVLRDSQATLKPRTYYFYQEQPGGNLREAWALGGSLEYRTGSYRDRFSAGIELFTSQPLYAPEDRDGTLLLGPGQEGYTVLGQAYVNARIGDDEVLTAGRSVYDTPWVNRQFNRMTPNTFQGVSLKGSSAFMGRTTRFDYEAGYLSKIKQRNADEFTAMSLAAGGDEERGTAFGRVLFTAWGVSFGLAEYFTPQTLNILYGEASYSPKLSGPWQLKVSLQATDERVPGNRPLEASAPLSNNVGVRTTLSRGGTVLTLAASSTSDSGGIVSPWGSNPTFTSAVIKNNNLAGEKEVFVSYAQDLAAFGAEGWNAVAIYVRGWNGHSPATGESLPAANELDLSLDYRVARGPLAGMWLRVQRNALRAGGQPEATSEWRAIVNWEIPLL